jgi:hypothetical protein
MSASTTDRWENMWKSEVKMPRMILKTPGCWEEVLLAIGRQPVIVAVFIASSKAR